MMPAREIERASASFAAGTAPPAETLRVRMHAHWTEAPDLWRRWRALLEANPSLTIFSTPEWLEPWWNAYGREGALRVLVFERETGETVGVVPLHIDELSAGPLPKLRRLRLVGDGSGDSDNLDAVAARGWERAVGGALVEWLAGRDDWDLCQLTSVPEHSAALGGVLDAVRRAGWTHAARPKPWSAVALPAAWDEYLEQLSSKERGKVRNRLRRLEKRYETRFWRCGTHDELGPLLDALFALHQKRWTARGLPGSFAEAERRRFYREMAARLLDAGRLELWALALNGRTVAVQFGFRFRDTVYSLQEGFDPDHGTDSVGYVLRSHVLREMIESGARRYEFLGGENDSKQRWGCEVGRYVDLHVARPGGLGGLHVRREEAWLGAKRWMRRSLSPRAQAALLRLAQATGVRPRTGAPEPTAVE